MTTVTVDGRVRGVLRIRPYRPEDREQVVKIFRQGMEGLAGTGCKQSFEKYRTLQALTVALPAAVIGLAPRRLGVLSRSIAGLIASSVIPVAVFGILRHLMKSYVDKSLTEDMSNIESFYSSAGAGHGSAFWVAEILIDGSSQQPRAPSVTSKSANGGLAARTASSDQIAAVTPASANVAAELPAPAVQTAFTTASARVVPHVPEAIGDDPTAAESVPGMASTSAAGETDLNAVEDEQEEEEGEEEEDKQTCRQEADSDDTAAAEPCPSEGGEVRRLVAGIVAATVAKFESESMPATPGNSFATPQKVPPAAAADVNTSPVGRAPATKKAANLQTQGSDLARAPSLLPGPGTPGAPVEPRSQLSYTATAATSASPALKPSPSASRFRTASADSFTNGTNGVASSSLPTTSPSPRPAAATNSAAASAPTAAPRSIIVGHVALERKSWTLAELRRMSVAPGYRGLGIGRRLLETLTQHARDNQFRELVLYTSGMQPTARHLYKSAGWEETEVVTWRGLEVYTYKLDLIKKR